MIIDIHFHYCSGCYCHVVVQLPVFVWLTHVKAALTAAGQCQAAHQVHRAQLSTVTSRGAGGALADWRLPIKALMQGLKTKPRHIFDSLNQNLDGQPPFYQDLACTPP